MRKKLIITILASILITTQAITAWAAEPTNETQPPHIMLDGMLVHLNHEAVLLDGRTMIDVRDAALFTGHLGLTSGDISALTAEYNGRSIFSLREAVTAANLQISWQPQMNLIQISSNNPNHSILPHQRQRPQADTIMSMGEALERINDRDNNLIAIEDNRIFIEREQRQVRDALNDNNIRGRSRNYTMPEVQLLRTREMLSNQLAAMDYNIRMIKEGNEMLLRSNLAAIERARLDIIMLEAQKALEENILTLTGLRHSLGLASDTELRDAEQSMARIRSNLEAQRLTLADNNLALNNLLGLSAATNLAITGLTWQAAGPGNLENHIEAVLDEAPTVALRQLDLNYALYMQFSYDRLLLRDEQEDYYRYRGRRQDSSTVIELRNEVNLAGRNLDNARDNIERQIRSAYNNLSQLAERQAMIEADLAAAIQDYVETAVLYMAGLATRIELQGAELAILSQEIALEHVMINSNMAMLSYEMPHLN